MSFTNKSILCPDCGTTFNFTVGEQEFYASKGLTNDPRRCPRCRQARKRLREGSHGGYISTRFSGEY
jgi:ribosomal protein S27AE